jgi:formylmethanofuran dehydrogenase subunit E
VTLKSSIERIISRPGVRVNCDLCGEEIMNEREVHQNGLTLCPSCAGGGYYQVNQQMVFHLSRSMVERI